MSSPSVMSCATLAAVSCAALVSVSLPSWAVARVDSRPTLEAAVYTAGSGHARLALAEPRDVVTGASKRPSTARALASADFDGDGNADVATGFATDTDGIVSVALGDGRGGFRPAADVVVPEAAYLLVAGDLDGDGRQDLAAAARRGTEVFVLRGDGKGGFALVARRTFPGGATAIAAGEIGPRDGVADLAVAVSDGSSDAVVVYPKTGAEPERVDLATEAVSLAISDVDADGLGDLAVAAGPELVLVSGRTHGAEGVVTLGFERPLDAVVAGHFLGGARLAALETGGDVSFVVAGAKARQASLSVFAESALAGATGLVAAKVSTGQCDDLVALGGEGGALRALATEDGRTVELSTPLAAPVAAVATRLNGDALSDLVVLDGRGSAPRAMLTAAAATFTVTTTNDSGDGSLRKAIEDANASPGADLIAFDIPGKGVHTIAPAVVLPTIKDPVTIDGYTQPGSRPNALASGGDAVILVELDGSNTKGLADGVHGLFVTTGATTIRGLAINRFGDAAAVETDAGVAFSGDGPTFDSILAGCYIGTDATGSIARGNGNLGVGISNAEVLVGGPSPADRNVISGNRVGLQIANEASASVVNNYVGTDRAGTLALGNVDAGVDLRSEATGSLVASNAIAFNGTQGVRVVDSGGITISKNAIFANGGPGIDLGGDGATANDAGDADAGANGLQNFPVLTSATSNRAGLVVAGTLDSTPNTGFVIELFLDDASAGQARRVVAETATVTTSANGSAAFEVTIPGATAAAVTATATNVATGDTSELSAPLAVEAETRVVCLVDDTTGDTFSIGVLQGDAAFGTWTYRIAKTGRTISGKAPSMVFVQPGQLKALEFDGIGIRMNANVSIDTAKGKAKVIDTANGVKLLVATDSVQGGGC